VPVAAISDLHGNLAALAAVAGELERLEVDVVVCGDVVTGPFSAEVFDRASRLRNVRFVHGDVETAVLEGTDEHGRDWDAERRRLGDARLAAIADWPRSLELEIEGLGRALFCHSTPLSEDPIYTRLTPDEELVELLGPVGADVLVCGHTHMQYERELSSGLRVVNPGSVGMPYQGRRGAYWAVLGAGVDFRRSEYDVDAAVEEMRAAVAPVDEQQLELLLQPMDPDTAAARFETMRGA
jgi:putative phosphoesterase